VIFENLTNFIFPERDFINTILKSIIEKHNIHNFPNCFWSKKRRKKITAYNPSKKVQATSRVKAL